MEVHLGSMTPSYIVFNLAAINSFSLALKQSPCVYNDTVYLFLCHFVLLSIYRNIFVFSLHTLYLLNFFMPLCTPPLSLVFSRITPGSIICCNLNGCVLIRTRSRHNAKTYKQIGFTLLIFKLFLIRRSNFCVVLSICIVIVYLCFK